VGRSSAAPTALSRALRCPFHGFTWSLEGALVEVPCEWDFPHVDRAAYRLPEAHVATWGGFVFVNPDPAAPPLDEYLGALSDHFASYPLEDRHLTANVAKVLAVQLEGRARGVPGGVPHVRRAPPARHHER
jgi:phenylpropionate dioxygenase-like ring-hydroxylating dioxygenase large terminal subunit